MIAFIKAVVAGALAGAALPMTLTVMLALDGLVRGDPLLSMLLLGLFPLFITVPVVLAAALAIGLPVSVVLEKAGRESRAAYISAGAATGIVLPLLFSGLSELSSEFVTILPTDDTLHVWWIGSFFGAVSGAVTGNVWWQSHPKPKLS